jgi:hypothetical protein
MSKQHALCKMAYSMEACVLIVKTIYQTSSFVTVSEEIQQAPARSSISNLVQKFKLTGKVCDNKKGVVGRHISACMQANIVYMKCCFGVLKSVILCCQLLGIKRTSTHTHLYDGV